MMKFLTTALGGLTMLTVTGLATPPGQAMLGMRQPQAQVPVSVIADPGPAKAAVPVAAPVVPAAQPAPAAPRPAVAQPVSSPASVARPVPRAAAPAAAPAPQANPMGGIGGAGAITNILLNLPQVLQGGQGAPAGPDYAPGQWVPRGHKRHDGGDNNAGDYER